MGRSSPQTIKICHIVDALNIGGLEKNLISIILETPQFCHAVWCLRNKGALAAILEDKGVEVREFNFSGRLRLSGIRIVANQMRKGDFNIVHCHGLYPSIWGRIAGFLAGVRVRLVHVQNIYDNLPVWQRIKLKLLSYLTTRCIAVSNAVRNSLVKDIGINPKIITVVHNSSADIQAKDNGNRDVLHRELGFSEGDLVVGNIGRIEEHKGHRYLVEAIAHCRAAGYRCKCVIMGEGQAKSGLEQQVNELGLKQDIVLLRARTQIEDILLSCDIFVQPSILREGLPLALAEAASAGLALVATDIGGNAEIVRDGWNGFVVSPKDPSTLAQKIGYLASNPEKRKIMGQNSRALWQEQFSDKVMARNISAIYEQEISLHF